MAGDEHLKLMTDQLNALTSYGIEYLMIIEGAVRLLELNYLGQIELSETEQREAFEAINGVLKDYKGLIKRSLQIRKSGGSQNWSPPGKIE